MPGHDIIVIGASAGGIEAVSKLISNLPMELPATLFVVQHIPALGPSLLAEIFRRIGPLPAVQAEHGMAITPGMIVVAPPDHHLLLARGHMHVVRGMKENGFRPAVDALFRTAAHSYGPRVIGVVLTGMLDDGTAGLLAVKRKGGIAVVQDPLDAAFPSMPANARRYVKVDAVLPVSAMAPFLAKMVAEPVIEEAAFPHDGRGELEARITAMDHDALQQADTLGVPSPFSCPDCGGVLAEYYDGDLLRFRCQIGHAYSPESVIASQIDALEYSLWAAYRALNERVTMLQRLVANAHRLNDSASEQRFTSLVTQVEAQKEHIYKALMKDPAEDELSVSPNGV